MTEQDWTNVGGAEAFQLIERHAEDWADAGRMMDAWRDVQTARLNTEWMAKCEELRKDALRYRWLREGDQDQMDMFGSVWGESLDGAIDSKLAKKEGA